MCPRFWLSLATLATTMLTACTTPSHRSHTPLIEPRDTSNRVEAPAPAPPHSPRSSTPELQQEPPTNLEAPSRSAVVRSASQLVGALTIESDGRSIAYDCAGVTRAIFLEHGIDLYSDSPGDPKANGVRLIYNHVSRHGILHQGPVASPGDLIFFDNTWDINGDGKPNDPLTHVGVVENVEPDGTVVFISRVAAAIARYRMNLDQPHVHKTVDGRVLNDYLRRKRTTDPKAIGRLTGELFASFGNRLTHRSIQHARNNSPDLISTFEYMMFPDSHH